MVNGKNIGLVIAGMIGASLYATNAEAKDYSGIIGTQIQFKDGTVMEYSLTSKGGIFNSVTTATLKVKSAPWMPIIIYSDKGNDGIVDSVMMYLEGETEISGTLGNMKQYIQKENLLNFTRKDSQKFMEAAQKRYRNSLDDMLERKEEVRKDYEKRFGVE